MKIILYCKALTLQSLSAPVIYRGYAIQESRSFFSFPSKTFDTLGPLFVKGNGWKILTCKYSVCETLIWEIESEIVHNRK